MGRKDITQRPEPSKADVAHSVARVAISAVPYVGGPGVEILNAILIPPIVRRRDEWVEELATRLVDLEKHVDGLKLEDLKDNEAFVSVALQASQLALRTHQKEKLNALRNAVLNAALPGAPDDDLQQLFIGLVDTLTAWHLRMLVLLDDPRQFLTRVGKALPGAMISSVGRVITTAFPELTNRREFYDLIGKELYAKGLTNTESYHTNMTHEGALDRRTTDVGMAFLRFVTEPDLGEA